MVKTKKHNLTKKNVTKKIQHFTCNDLIYKPFVPEYKKRVRYGKNIQTKKIQKIFLKKLNAQFKENSINPKNDFYNWVNKYWLEDKIRSSIQLNKNQGYIVEIDEFRIVQDKVYNELIDIVTEYIKNNSSEKAENLNKFYKSALHGIDNITLKKEALKFVEYYDELRKDKKNIWKLLAFINKNEIISPLAPLSFGVAQDNKNSKYNTCYIYPHTFFLTDINVYYDDGTEVEYKKKFREQYSVFVQNIFSDALGKHTLESKAPFTVEQKIFNALGCNSIKGAADNYNVVTEKDALEIYQFNWSEFCKEYGFSNVPSSFVCSDLNYLNCCTDLMLKEWDSDEWKSYWIFLYIFEL